MSDNWVMWTGVQMLLTKRPRPNIVSSSSRQNILTPRIYLPSISSRGWREARRGSFDSAVADLQKPTDSHDFALLASRLLSNLDSDGYATYV